MNLLLIFPLVCLFKRLLFCSLQPEYGFRLSQISKKAKMNYKTCALLWLSYVVFKTISNEAKVYFCQLEKTAKRLIRVEEHLQFNEVCLKEDLLSRYTNFI